MGPSRAHAPFCCVRTPAFLYTGCHPGTKTQPGWGKLPGREIPAVRNYQAAKSRQLNPTGTSPAFQPGSPGRVWAWLDPGPGVSFLAQTRPGGF